jgi:hypothetical protein
MSWPAPAGTGAGGAAAWGGGAAGVVGSASSSNSLVGGTSGHNAEYVGIRVTALASDHYVVANSFRNGHMAAAAWGNGASGVVGVVSSSNSLIGSHAVAGVGQAIIPLTNGDDGVAGENWNGCQGAVAWGGGTAGVAGVVSSSNSLVGSHQSDRMGDVLTPLTKGNYVTSTSAWNNSAGEATWGGGTAGVAGAVSAADSLVGVAGGANGDQAGGGLAARTLPEDPEHPESETSRPGLPGVSPESAPAGGAAGRRKHLYRMLLPAAPPGADGSPAN